MLRRQGSAVGRARVARLMKKMGIEAIYRKSNTSRRDLSGFIGPFSFRNLGSGC
jgi:putative transposase